ncbi:siderophore-mediated iron transport protein TonB [Sulfurimonas gotlandica GD1]|uniref:Siderophore-mediated iron transport protein TonB n=2 Tax=Sulfurimonas TaxID=202746 RepID=B6BN59_SULGG|nr:energy transducer TonB [Sulfurimonas gotlandica]EDZ61547.1 siderophore-mediated iron transport protein [Sulfurimonas gotlandica GD1]EHP30664.1 siderophore-mediated iron transport protein TonB [Sulfurimonas gotlandica GD1]
MSKVDCENKICVQLCDVIVEKPAVKPAPKPAPKPKLKPIPKELTKPKFKPKPIVKKIEIVKEVPVVMPELIKEESVVEVVKEEIAEEKPVEATQIVQEQIIEEQIVQEESIVEGLEAKQVRLEQEYMQEHIAKIIQLLQDNLYYPRRARKRGTVGEVMVKFTLSTDAVAHSIKVVSSNSEILSRAAIKTIEELSGKFPKPSEVLILHVPINYSLKM